jgi:hypothetical protein
VVIDYDTRASHAAVHLKIQFSRVDSGSDLVGNNPTASQQPAQCARYRLSRRSAIRAIDSGANQRPKGPF